MTNVSFEKHQAVKWCYHNHMQWNQVNIWIIMTGNVYQTVSAQHNLSWSSKWTTDLWWMSGILGADIWWNATARADTFYRQWIPACNDVIHDHSACSQSQHQKHTDESQCLQPITASDTHRWITMPAANHSIRHTPMNHNACSQSQHQTHNITIPS